METSIPTSQKSKLLTQLIQVFLWMGIAGLLAGGIHVLALISDGYNHIGASDAIFNAGLGVMDLICYRLLKGTKRLTIAVYAIAVIATLVYAFAMGRGLNIVMLILGMAILGGLAVLFRRGELNN